MSWKKRNQKLRGPKRRDAKPVRINCHIDQVTGKLVYSVDPRHGVEIKYKSDGTFIISYQATSCGEEVKHESYKIDLNSRNKMMERLRKSGFRAAADALDPTTQLWPNPALFGDMSFRPPLVGILPIKRTSDESEKPEYSDISDKPSEFSIASLSLGVGNVTRLRLIQGGKKTA